MRITGIDARIVRLPVAKTVGLPMAGGNDPTRSSIDVLLAQVETDGGITGVGFAYAPNAGRSLLAAIADDVSPLLIGEDPLRHEWLWAKTHSNDGSVSHRAYAAIDVALWDLKGKAAGQPLWRLLGGARESARAFTAETASACAPPDEIIGIGRAAIAQGIGGLRVAIRGLDPEAESHNLVTIRDALGEEVWFAVGVENSFDYETALPMVRFIEEEIGADWFEDPLADDDLAGYARLAARIDTPLAAGGRFTSPSQFLRLIESGTPVTLRPDISRLGGLTPLLKVATLAELHRRPLVPRLMPEIGVQLACGLPSVNAVEHVAWLAPILRDPPRWADGRLVAPDKPGLGLEWDREALVKHGHVS